MLGVNVNETLLTRLCGLVSKKVLVKERTLIVRAPASIANLGPGFDVLAVALEEPEDLIEFKVCEGGGNVEVLAEGYSIPSGERNLAYAVVKTFLSVCDLNNLDFSIRIRKGVPPSSGLGSSGASASGVAYALLKALNVNFSLNDVIYLAGVGEAFVAGEPHYDNVAASTLGGFVLVDVNSLNFYRIPTDLRPWIAVVTPKTFLNVEYKTKYARSVLPKDIPLKELIKQTSSLAKLIYALTTNDLRKLGEAISSDYIVEPHRSRLIPYYNEIKELSIRFGALGLNIAGAGPSVFMLCEDREIASSISKRVKDYLMSKGVPTYSLVTKVSKDGVRVKASLKTRLES